MLLIVGANDTPNAEHRTNQALAAISEWGKSVKLTFSPLKTNAIAFTNKANHANISMDGIRIEFQREIKFLGVIIDDKLNFNAHVKYAIKKATKVFKKLCMFVRPTWGIHAENVTTIYRQVIETNDYIRCRRMGPMLQKNTTTSDF